jgi:hypothetical protein
MANNGSLPRCKQAMKYSVFVQTNHKQYVGALARTFHRGGRRLYPND